MGVGGCCSGGAGVPVFVCECMCVDDDVYLFVCGFGMCVFM